VHQALTPIDRQLLTICRRVASLIACEESPAWSVAQRLASEVSRQVEQGRFAQAAELARRASLPTACADRFLTSLSAAHTPRTPDLVTQQLLQRIEVYLGARSRTDIRGLSPATRAAITKLLAHTLRNATAPRTLARAVSVTVLMEAAALRPAVEALVAREGNAELAAMARVAATRLAASSPARP